MTFVSEEGFSDFPEDCYQTKWDYLIDKHNCTKLVAACICFIELEDDK
jgi:hypothetical protein